MEVTQETFLMACRGNYWDGYFESHASRCDIKDCEICYIFHRGYEVVPKAIV